MVRKKGLEPSHPFGYKLLRLARLPIPPLPHEGGTRGRSGTYSVRARSPSTRAVDEIGKANRATINGVSMVRASPRVTREIPAGGIKLLLGKRLAEVIPLAIFAT